MEVRETRMIMNRIRKKRTNGPNAIEREGHSKREKNNEEV
jgi:hypothetical protein